MVYDANLMNWYAIHSKIKFFVSDKLYTLQNAC